MYDIDDNITLYEGIIYHGSESHYFLWRKIKHVSVVQYNIKILTSVLIYSDERWHVLFADM